MNLLVYMILFHLNFKVATTSFLNQEELTISLKLIEKLDIRQCILVGNIKTEDLISIIKEFSLGKVPVTFLNYVPLGKYIDATKIVQFKTGLIFKEENLEILEEMSKIFEKAKKIYKLRNFVWLIFLKDTRKVKFDKIIVPYDCEFIVIQPKNATLYKLTEIYTVKERFYSLDFGTWTRNFGLQTSNSCFYCRRKNFQKNELRVMAGPDLNEDNKNEKYKLYLHELFSGFAYKLNLTKSYEEFFRTFLTTGDIVGYPAQAFPNRAIAFDQVGPIYRTTVKWYIKHPSVKLKSDYYLQPFGPYLWLALFSVVTTATIIILITQNNERFLIDNLFLGLESIIGQCGNSDIENASLRIICISLRLLAFTSIGLYGAIITSFFAKEIFQPPFRNLREFIANGEYKLLKSNEIDSIIDDLLPNSENLTKFIPFHHWGEYIENACRGKYAICDMNADLKDYNLSCRLYLIPEYLTSLFCGLTLLPNSCYTTILSENLIRFYETGFQKRFTKAGDSDFSEDSFQPIEIDQMTQVTLIPIIGILLGGTIMITEIIISKFGKKKKGIKKGVTFRLDQIWL